MRDIRRPDLDTVAALARLQLLAGRLGVHLRVLNAGGRLRELLELTGLDEVLECAPPVPSGVDARRQAEEREEAGGVQEEGDASDPLA